MTRSKDFKRLVRDRMRKTGEAYTTARAQLVQKRPSTASVPSRFTDWGPDTVELINPEPASVQTAVVSPSDYAELAGMSDVAIKEKTGCDWKKWVKSLDYHGAAKLSHSEIAALLKKKYKTADWWTQMIAVGYERIRGLRTRGQRRDGLFSANKSRTFSVPVGQLFDAWIDADVRKRWMGPGARVRTSQKNRSIRLGLPDGNIVAVGFTAKGTGKSAVAVQQERVPTREAAAKFKEEWTERFDALARVYSMG